MTTFSERRLRDVEMRAALVATMFVAVLIIVGVLGIGGWSCHQPPKPNSETAQIKNNTGKDCSTFYGTIIAGFHDSGTFVTANHDEINAASAVAIAIFTAVLSVFTISLSGSTRIAANAAKESADVANKTLIATQRPWVTADVIVVGPLIFKNGGAVITLRYSLKNLGAPPAANANFNAKMFPTPLGKSSMQDGKLVIEIPALDA